MKDEGWLFTAVVISVAAGIFVLGVTAGYQLRGVKEYHDWKKLYEEAREL